MFVEDPDLMNCRLFLRWYNLRKSHPHLVPALLQTPGVGHVWTFSNPVDPWGSRERLSFTDLERLVITAEVAAGLRKACVATAPENAEKVRIRA